MEYYRNKQLLSFVLHAILSVMKFCPIMLCHTWSMNCPFVQCIQVV